MSIRLVAEPAIVASSLVSLDSGQIDPALATGPPAVVRELTARMAAGDEMAYVDFYDAYSPRLLRYLLVLTAGRQAAAEEALQLTLLRVVRHIRVFESEAVFWSWLTVLARSAGVDEARKQNRYFALLTRFFERRELEAQANHDAEAHWQSLLQASLLALPDDERQLLERKYFDGEAVKAIATATATTPKAVEARLVRVRRKLRDAILAQLNDETPIQS